jgi:hypothetical protein
VRVKIADVPADIDRLLPEAEEDNSGIGANYADAYLKALKTTLADGRRVIAQRRGLKITLKVGDRVGDGLLRRLEHGPDVRKILDRALREAARSAGVEFSTEDGSVYFSDAD